MCETQSKCPPTREARRATKWFCGLGGAQFAGLGLSDKTLTQSRGLPRAEACRGPGAWVGRQEGPARPGLLLWPPFQAGSGFPCHSSKGLTQLEDKQGPLPGSFLEREASG